MLLDDKDDKNFITDIEYDDKEIRITTADEKVTIIPFSEHNLGFYRLRMIENAKTYLGPCMDDIGRHSFFTYVKRVGAIIAGVMGMFLLYNVDIHIIMKIVLTILIALAEVGYYFYNELYLTVIGDEAAECLATEFYIKNLDKFKYYDNEHFTDGYIVPPEDIGKHHLSQAMLEQILEGIEQFRADGVEPAEMRMTYKRAPENGKNMI